MKLHFCGNQYTGLEAIIPFMCRSSGTSPDSYKLITNKEPNSYNDSAYRFSFKNCEIHVPCQPLFYRTESYGCFLKNAKKVVYVLSNKKSLERDVLEDHVDFLHVIKDLELEIYYVIFQTDEKRKFFKKTFSRKHIEEKLRLTVWRTVCYPPHNDSEFVDNIKEIAAHLLS